MKVLYIMLDGNNWVNEYSIKRIKDLITINDYPEGFTADPLNYKMVSVEEENETWYELIYEPRPEEPGI